MWFKYTEVVNLRLTKAQYDHCCQTGSYTEYIRELINRDMVGVTLEDRIRQVLNEMGVYDMSSTPIRNNVVSNTNQPPSDDVNNRVNSVSNDINNRVNSLSGNANSRVNSSSGNVSNRVNSSIRNIFDLK